MSKTIATMGESVWVSPHSTHLAYVPNEEKHLSILRAAELEIPALREEIEAENFLCVPSLDLIPEKRKTPPGGVRESIEDPRPIRKKRKPQPTIPESETIDTQIDIEGSRRSREERYRKRSEFDPPVDFTTLDKQAAPPSLRRLWPDEDELRILAAQKAKEQTIETQEQVIEAREGSIETRGNIETTKEIREKEIQEKEAIEVIDVEQPDTTGSTIVEPRPPADRDPDELTEPLTIPVEAFIQPDEE